MQTTLFSQKKTEQPADTLSVVEEPNFHSPTKASIMSAILPGLGQAYNRKYWKMPIIYAGLGTTLYFASSNNTNYQKYREAYRFRVDGDASTIEGDEFLNISDASMLNSIDSYKRDRDFFFILTGLVYVLNIVDASVDAHLFTFPKNDNLTINIQPTIQYTQNNILTKGLTLRITL